MCLRPPRFVRQMKKKNQFKHLKNDASSMSDTVKQSLDKFLASKVKFEKDETLEIMVILDIVAQKSDAFGTIQLSHPLKNKAQSLKISSGLHTVESLLSMICDKLDAEMTFDKRGRLLLVNKK